MVKIMSNTYFLQREEDKDGYNVYLHDIHGDGTRRRCLKKDIALSFDSVLMASHYKDVYQLDNYKVVKHEENSS
jgi:hypothetical protein